MDFFKDLQVNALLLTSPVDLSFGLTSVKRGHGSLQGLRSLINSYHQEGIKILIELSPNYVNDDHEWFKKAREQLATNSSIFADYFIWRSNPNDWVMTGPIELSLF